MSHPFLLLAEQIPLSHYFLSVYAELAADEDNDMFNVIRLAYAQVYRRDLAEHELEQVAKRLIAHGEGVKATMDALEAENRPSRGARQFYQYYQEWFAKLDMTQTCMWLAGYDLAKAQDLFYQQDYELVEHMVKVKASHDHELARATYEACMFGFGGKYGTGSKTVKDEGDVTVHDLSKLSRQEMADKIQSFGQRR